MELPCIDCIVLVMCRIKVLERLKNTSAKTQTVVTSYLFSNCLKFRDYIHYIVYSDKSYEERIAELSDSVTYVIGELGILDPSKRNTHDSPLRDLYYLTQPFKYYIKEK